MPGVAGTLRDLAPVVQGLPQQLLLLGTRLAVLGAQAGLALQPSLPVAQSPSLDRGEGGGSQVSPNLAAFDGELPLLDVVSRQPQVMEHVGVGDPVTLQWPLRLQAGPLVSC